MASAANSFDEKSWMNRYYQIANRLLFWNNLQTDYKITLIFLNFVNVPRFPTTIEKWDVHYNKIFNQLLGYGVSKLPSGIK